MIGLQLRRVLGKGNTVSVFVHTRLALPLLKETGFDEFLK